MKRPLNLALACFFAMFMSSNAVAQLDRSTITTPQIVLETTNLDCMSWRIVGECTWLRCSILPPVCEVRISVKVRHRSPSVVVTAYDVLDGSPWTEMRFLYGSVQEITHNLQTAIAGTVPNAGPGSGDMEAPVTQKDQPRKGQLAFFNAEVYGGPGSVATIAATGGLPLFCPMTDITPLGPYFQSGPDSFAWRSALTEVIYAATWIPGMSELGNWPFNTWGNIFPRHGFIDNSDSPKSAAVIASRAADIASKENQPHVYVPIGQLPGEWPDGGMRVWEPGDLDHEEARWQMHVPNPSGQCLPFGENDTLDVYDGWSNDKVASSSNYLWTLWRTYACCRDEGIFLFDIEF